MDPVRGDGPGAAAVPVAAVVEALVALAAVGLVDVDGLGAPVVDLELAGRDERWEKAGHESGGELEGGWGHGEGMNVAERTVEKRNVYIQESWKGV